MKITSSTQVSSFVATVTGGGAAASVGGAGGSSAAVGVKQRLCTRTVVESDAISFLQAALSAHLPPGPAEGSESAKTLTTEHPSHQCDQETLEAARNLWKPSASVVTSIPDVCEVSMSVDQWKQWFSQAAFLILSNVAPQQVAIFYQTDIKVDGRWIDKGFLVQKAAERAQTHLLWHKVVMITKPNEVKFGRPGYSHMLCFSKEKLEDIAYSTPDVIDRGEMTWAKAMGLKACVVAVRYIKKFVPGCDLVIDPFCGKGSILAVANEFGLDSLGIEISAKRCRDALALQTNTLESETEGKQQRKQKEKQRQGQEGSQEPAPEQQQEATNDP